MNGIRNGIRLIAVLLSVGLLFQASASQGSAEQAKPLAIWFYADWCTNCKLLAPKYEAAHGGFENRIQFVTLDVTSETTKENAKSTAQALGVAPLYFSNHATGWVALVNIARIKVGELRYDESVDDMRAALEKLAQGS